MSTGTVFAGQRWVSDSEPELGLGLVLKVDATQVEIFFPAAGEHRRYARRSAPLRRVQFKEGDQIKSHEGASMVVESVEERSGLLTYIARGRALPEAELSDTLSFSKPEERLLIGQVDELHTFEMRADALQWRAKIRRAPVRGFLGGRVDLIAHQLFIASETASRLAPRVLLADEVGLGKTIEAGLILHRLHLTGRAARILVLVPESLAHQWFIELYRKFNLSFSIFDEERCGAIEAQQPGTNPFLDSQLVLCSLAFVADSPARSAQLLAAGWDLLVVDEAHHLAWTPGAPSPGYALVEALGSAIPGLLLLTATPHQLGMESHFARLRLLDPERYADLARFKEEAAHYERVASAVDRLRAGGELSSKDHALFGGASERIRQLAAAIASGAQGARDELVAALLDGFGTGRVMFRNTRAGLTGFPERRATLYPIAPGTDELHARVRWLAGLLRELGSEKVLLICRTRELVEAIAARLQREIAVACAIFHEDLTLLQRDRNAAYFAADEEGARILLCSEIGSEGRNFQFAHHLVLFDLPENPELLEQRIGRLDRIGQASCIRIHVPCVQGSAGEVLARWFHEGLNAFEKTPHGALEVQRAVASALGDLRAKPDAKKLTRLVSKTRSLHEAMGEKLQRGYDRLLELNSCKPEAAAALAAQIRAEDQDRGFEQFFFQMLDHFGVQHELLSTRTFLLKPGHLLTEALPALPEHGLSVTLDRSRALSREDLGFLSSDHPLMTAALDLLLGSEAGNAAFALWKSSGTDGLLLEVWCVVECVAPSGYHLDRFLPATPVRVVVDHQLEDLSADTELPEAVLEKGDPLRVLEKGVVKRKVFPAMLEKAQTIAASRMEEVVAGARTQLGAELGAELARLRDLQELNDHVRPAEIEAAELRRRTLEEALSGARLRVDALRFILRTA